MEGHGDDPPNRHRHRRRKGSQPMSSLVLLRHGESGTLLVGGRGRTAAEAALALFSIPGHEVLELLIRPATVP